MPKFRPGSIAWYDDPAESERVKVRVEKIRKGGMPGMGAYYRIKILSSFLITNTYEKDLYATKDSDD